MVMSDQRRLWLTALFVTCLMSAPLLFIDVSLEVALKISIALSAIALVFSIIIMVFNYNPLSHSRYIGISIMAAALIITWLSNTILHFWPHNQPHNFLLNLISALLLPTSLIAVSKVHWAKPLKVDHTMGMLVVVVVASAILLDINNFMPFNATQSEVMGYMFFGWVLAAIGVILLIRNRYILNVLMPTQTAFAVAVVVITVTTSALHFMDRPDAEIIISLAIAGSVATFMVAVKVAQELFWAPNIERENESNEIKQKYKQLRQVIDQLPAGILWKDKHSRFLGGNTYFLNALGLKDESELQGLSEYDLRHGSVEEFLQQDRRVMESGKPILESYERYRLEDERMTFNRISRAPLRDEDGNIYGMVAYYTEIEQIDNDGKLYRVRPNLEINQKQFYSDNLVNDFPLTAEDLTDEQINRFIENLNAQEKPKS